MPTLSHQQVAAIFIMTLLVLPSRAHAQYDPAKLIWNGENQPAGGNSAQNAPINLSRPIFATGLFIGGGQNWPPNPAPFYYPFRVDALSGTVAIGFADDVLFASFLTGKVGIGTSNPQVKFDVVGDARVSGNLDVGGAITGTVTPLSGAGMPGATPGSLGQIYIDVSAQEAYICVHPAPVWKRITDPGQTAVVMPDNPIGDRLRISPNPTRRGAAIELALDVPTHLCVEVFDVQGRRVVTLSEGTTASGAIRLTWNGSDESGRIAPAGVYVVRARYEGRSVEERLVLAR